MMTQNTDKKREQLQMFCMDDMVPKDHLLRLIVVTPNHFHFCSRRTKRCIKNTERNHLSEIHAVCAAQGDSGLLSVF